MGKSQLVDLISEKINKTPYSSLENFALFILREKIVTNSASSEDRILDCSSYPTPVL